MTESACKLLAIQLMRQHGLLPKWRFEFNNRKRGLGLCAYSKTTIFVSRFHCAKDSDEEIRDTILHEIAHALTGPSPNPHGEQWQLNCLKVGAKPERCAARGATVEVQGNWFGVCPNCNKEFNFHREPKYKTNRWCLACGKEKGKFSVQKRQEIKAKPRSMFD